VKDREGGRFPGKGLEEGGELVGGLLDERGVECPGHGQSDGPAFGLLDQCLGRVQRLGLARDDELGRGVVVGDAQLLAGLLHGFGHDLLDLVLGQLDHGGHAVARAAAVGHEPSAPGHGPDAVLHVEDSGRAQGGEFAQGVPGRGRGGELVLHGQPQGQVDHGQGGLQGAGVGHVGRFAVPVDFAQGQAGLALGQLPEVQGGGIRLGHVAAHALFLGSLSGEENAGLGHE